MNSRFLWKIILFIAVGILLVTINADIVPMMVADSAVSQLEDSDSAYLGFKFTQHLGQILAVVYVIFAGFLFRKEITDLFKGDK